MTLLERTKNLLLERQAAGISLQAIADASGGTVKHEWLKKFRYSKKLKSSSADRVEALHDCLKKIRVTN